VAHSSPQQTFLQPTRHQRNANHRNNFSCPTAQNEDLTTTLEVISLAGLLSGILDRTTTSTLVKNPGRPY
jgi:hypothetical protein